MARSSLILITGATGAVGPLVVKAFHDLNYSIRTFSIDPPPVEIWPDDVETRIGDVTDRKMVQSTMRGVDAVVHLAALLHIFNPPPELREKYDRINVGGTRTVVEAAIEAGVGRVVLFSTIAVYGPSYGRVFTEDTKPHPDTFYAETKLAAEEILLHAKRRDGQPLGTVLRLGAVYGSRVRGNYERLTRALARNRFIPIGTGHNRRTLIYDQDVGRAAVLAAFHPAAAGRVFNVTDGQFHTLHEIINSICDALGRKFPVFSLPVAPVRRFAGLLEVGARTLGRRSPVDRSTIDKYTEDIAVSGRRIQNELGFIPQYDLRTGWRETVAEMRRKVEL
jgi:UDP-glucose 4-epimerase